MSNYKRLLKDLASKLLCSEDNSNLTFNKPRVSQAVLPFVSADKLRCIDYYGDGAYNVLERRPFVLDYEEGMTDGKKIYFKSVRRKLRGVLCNQISDLEDNHKPNARLEIDFENFVLTKLASCDESIPPTDYELSATDLQASNSNFFKRFGFNRVQMQCCNSEYQLLESLRRSGAGLMEVTCLQDEVTADADYGFPVKNEGISFSFSSIIHLNPVTLSPEEWEYLSFSPSYAMIIPPSHLQEMCGLNIKTHITKRMKFSNEAEERKSKAFLPCSDFENLVWRNGTGQFCTKPDCGIKNITVKSQRRIYTLQLGAITLFLHVCQKQVYRVKKQTGATWLANNGSCIPSIHFSNIDSNVDAVSRTVALISIKFLRESNTPRILSFVPMEYFLLTSGSILPASCKLFQRFRLLKKRENFSKVLSKDDVSRMKVEFEAWIKSNAHMMD